MNEKTILLFTVLAAMLLVAPIISSQSLPASEPPSEELPPTVAEKVLPRPPTIVATTWWEFNDKDLDYKRLMRPRYPSVLAVTTKPEYQTND